MRFVPYSNDRWFRLRPLSRPDREESNYLRQQGEWSVYAEESFNKHLKELNKWTKFFSKLNGRKIMEIIRHEPLRYGTIGLIR